MIQLDDEYFIDADDFQYKLGKPYTTQDSKTGKMVTRMDVSGYFNSLENALIYYKSLKVREVVKNQNMHLSGAIAFIRNENERLKKLMHEALEGKHE